MLTIGAALLGSNQVFGIDVDEDALDLAQQNIEDFEDPLPVSYNSVASDCSPNFCCLAVSHRCDAQRCMHRPRHRHLRMRLHTS